MHGGKIVGARQNRSKTDAYFTPSECTEALLKYGDIPTTGSLVLEPCCGDGAISKVLKEFGYTVFSSDIVDFGYGKQINFLNPERFKVKYQFDAIITNPPYKDAEEFINKSIYVAPYVAMFLRLSFLEGIKRGKGIFR